MLSSLTRQLGSLSLRQNLAKGLIASQPTKTFPTISTRLFSKKDDSNSTLQHQEWVKFQQSIAVEGFETGQTLVAKEIKKTRGGKKLNRQNVNKLEKKLKERQRLTDVGGGLFPPMRYTDEETERLLAEAYAAVPKRDGKRGTRNLKRQNYRWHLVRQIRKKYKYHLKNFQTRKMEKRSLKVAQVKQVLQESPETRQRDKEYQLKIAQQWQQMSTSSNN